MSTHWKAILSAGAGIVSLAVVLSAATHRSQREAAPVPTGMTTQQAAVATSRAASASGSVIPAALPPPATTSSQAEAKDSAPAGLRQVEPQTVCMVNDRAMGKPQIPVEVDEKTYYGCCAMCKERLAQDEAVRYATDPVTGQRVDKASAVIAERADGSVLYFASEETLARFGEPDDEKH